MIQKSFSQVFCLYWVRITVLGELFSRKWRNFQNLGSKFPRHFFEDNKNFEENRTRWKQTKGVCRLTRERAVFLLALNFWNTYCHFEENKNFSEKQKNFQSVKKMKIKHKNPDSINFFNSQFYQTAIFNCFSKTSASFSVCASTFCLVKTKHVHFVLRLVLLGWFDLGFTLMCSVLWHNAGM